MDDKELAALVKKARRIAEPVGPMHSLWDTIFDAEAILSGQPSLLPRAEIEKILLRHFD